jgi:hypothetical protein
LERDVRSRIDFGWKDKFADEPTIRGVHITLFNWQ